MTPDELDAAMAESYDNEIDSDSDETKKALNEPETNATRFIVHPELNGLVCKRQRGAVATLRVSSKVWSMFILHNNNGLNDPTSYKLYSCSESTYINSFSGK